MKSGAKEVNRKFLGEFLLPKAKNKHFSHKNVIKRRTPHTDV